VSCIYHGPRTRRPTIVGVVDRGRLGWNVSSVPGGHSGLPQLQVQISAMKLVLASVLLVFAGITPSIACQCGKIPDARQARSMVPLVVAGRAEVLRQEIISPLFSKMTVRIRIERAWKGNPPSDLELVVGPSDCDYTHFEEAQRYLIFAEVSKGRPGAWSASKYKPTKLLRDATAEIQLMGPGQPRVPGPGRGVGFSWLMLSWIAGACAALVVLLSRLRRRQSR